MKFNQLIAEIFLIEQTSDKFLCCPNHGLSTVLRLIQQRLIIMHTDLPVIVDHRCIGLSSQSHIQVSVDRLVNIVFSNTEYVNVV